LSSAIIEPHTSHGPRVAVVTSRLDVGGTERHLTRILPALQRRGIDVALYLMERGGVLEADLAAQGVRIEGPQRARFLHWPWAALKLAGFIRRERPDIVHFFLPRPYVYGSAAAELAGHRRRIMSRRSLTDYRARYPLLGGLERLLHGRTIALVGNSTAVVDQLAAEVGGRQQLALIHNGIDLPVPLAAAERQRRRGALRLSHDTLVLTVVANLIPYKGHCDLLAALALVKGELPAQWTLLLIGRNDGAGVDLKRQADALGVSDRILWLGERSDVGGLLGVSDIFVLPSHQEGFSNALLEAMAAAVPAVATAVGGNIDAVADGETGLLVRPKDPVALAAAILRLAKDPQLCRRLGQAARLRVQRHFSLDACVTRYERMYRGLNEPAPRPIGEILGNNASDASDLRGRATVAAAEHAN